MNVSRVPRFVRPAALVLCLILLVPGRGVLAQPLTAEQKGALVEKAEAIVQRNAFATGADFDRWAEIVARHQKQLDAANDGPSFSAALNAAMQEFGVSHISVLTPRAVENRKSTEIVGVGVASRVTEAGIVIERVVDESPASRAGLHEGDVLVEVDGARPASTSVLRGEDGSTLAVKVKRAESGAEEVLSITRAKFSTREPETITWLGENAAMIRVSTFDTGYNRERVESLFKELNEHGAKDLVVDLRSNGGGEMSNFLHFLGFLLDSGTAIGTSVNRRVAEDYAEATGGDPEDAVAVAAWATRKVRVPRSTSQPFRGRVAVLVNRGSASASEIVAAALRELRGAPIVGGRSAGAVMVSRYHKLEEGFEIKVPFSEYITCKGRRLEGNPLVPDQVVEFRRSRTDRAPRAALDLLHADEVSDESERPE